MTANTVLNVDVAILSPVLQKAAKQVTESLRRSIRYYEAIVKFWLL